MQTPSEPRSAATVPVHLVLLKMLADAPRQWIDDADLFVKYTAWLRSIGGERQ